MVEQGGRKSDGRIVRADDGDDGHHDSGTYRNDDDDDGANEGATLRPAPLRARRSTQRWGSRPHARVSKLDMPRKGRRSSREADRERGSPVAVRPERSSDDRKWSNRNTLLRQEQREKNNGESGNMQGAKTKLSQRQQDEAPATVTAQLSHGEHATRMPPVCWECAKNRVPGNEGKEREFNVFAIFRLYCWGSRTEH